MLPEDLQLCSLTIYRRINKERLNQSPTVYNITMKSYSLTQEKIIIVFVNEFPFVSQK